MKIVCQSSNDEETIAEFEDAFEAAYEPPEAAYRREAAMEAREQRLDPSRMRKSTASPADFPIATLGE
jgi:hypothetical protein